MGLLINLLLSAVHLFLVATDILFLLLLMKMLSYRWQPQWLTAFNSLGKPAADWFSGYIEKALRHISKKVFSEKIVLFIGMLAISFIRIFFSALLGRWEPI
jgi:hypothetical protein